VLIKFSFLIMRVQIRFATGVDRRGLDLTCLPFPTSVNEKKNREGGTREVVLLTRGNR